MASQKVAHHDPSCEQYAIIEREALTNLGLALVAALVSNPNPNPNPSPNPNPNPNSNPNPNPK